uniref:Uncharacterized protein n=1 Tax=Anguilla anguilla TaxID=7936 RepID=A0A0E9QE83_ANGAN
MLVYEISKLVAFDWMNGLKAHLKQFSS